MSVEEALLSRRSVRAFLPRPVSRSTVERILELASRSASNSNGQPWQVHVLSGAAKDRLTAALLQAHDAGERVQRCEFDYQPRPDEWVEPFLSRRSDFGQGLYGETLGIDFTDLAGRDAHHRRNYEFFGAPVGIFLTVSRHQLDSALIDAGLFLQATMLAARASGLDTCPQASFLDYYPVIRSHLEIADDHRIICGLSLGYADASHRLNSFATSRQRVTDFATFYEEGAEDAVTTDGHTSGIASLPQWPTHGLSAGGETNINHEAWAGWLQDSQDHPVRECESSV
ncbi:nitroreductase [Arthrobacter globiformis]|uniref:nitroreductase n=1 Tax=Arthrobacter globiformis TaxID=1665 RepID=UPI0027D79EBC|nr:nitroreductase [Arthrobacter globiformis]